MLIFVWNSAHGVNSHHTQGRKKSTSLWGFRTALWGKNTLRPSVSSSSSSIVLHFHETSPTKGHEADLVPSGNAATFQVRCYQPCLQRASSPWAVPLQPAGSMVRAHCNRSGRRSSRATAGDSGGTSATKRYSPGLPGRGGDNVGHLCQIFWWALRAWAEHGSVISFVPFIFLFCHATENKTAALLACLSGKFWITFTHATLEKVT